MHQQQTCLARNQIRGTSPASSYTHRCPKWGLLQIFELSAYLRLHNTHPDADHTLKRPDHGILVMEKSQVGPDLQHFRQTYFLTSSTLVHVALVRHTTHTAVTSKLVRKSKSCVLIEGSFPIHQQLNNRTPSLCASFQFTYQMDNTTSPCSPSFFASSAQ